MFFDLDGTLWDATESTARAWTDVFHQWNLNIGVSAEQIRRVAGRPYMNCLEIIAPQAVKSGHLPSLLKDLEISEKIWMERIGGNLYPFVLEGLRILSSINSLFLVSNCNDWYLEAFIKQSGLKDVFKETVCYGNTGLKKSDNLKKIMQSHKIIKGFYVGDTLGDKISAEDVGLVYLHANYGFGGNVVESENRYDDFRSIIQYLMDVQ